MPGRMTRIGLRAQLAHDVDLPRRRVRPQQHAGRRRVERVPHVARRVVRRHVEQVEVRLVVLDLAAAVDLEAHVGEDRRRSAAGSAWRGAAGRAAGRPGSVTSSGLAVRLRGQRLLLRLGEGSLRTPAVSAFLDPVGFLAVGLASGPGDRADALRRGARPRPACRRYLRVPGAQGGLVAAAARFELASSRPCASRASCKVRAGPLTSVRHGGIRSSCGRSLSGSALLAARQVALAPARRAW